MGIKYRFTEDLTADDPRNYANRNFAKGDEIFEFSGATYGCISYQGVACCDVERTNPFFELPWAVLEAI